MVMILKNKDNLSLIDILIVITVVIITILVGAIAYRRFTQQNKNLETPASSQVTKSADTTTTNSVNSSFAIYDDEFVNFPYPNLEFPNSWQLTTEQYGESGNPNNGEVHVNSQDFAFVPYDQPGAQKVKSGYKFRVTYNPARNSWGSLDGLRAYLGKHGGERTNIKNKKVKGSIDALEVVGQQSSVKAYRANSFTVTTFYKGDMEYRVEYYYPNRDDYTIDPTHQTTYENILSALILKR